MSRGSRLLPGTALLRGQSSSEAAQLFRRRSSFPAADDIDKKLMSYYNDSEFGESQKPKNRHEYFSYTTARWQAEAL